MQKRSTALVLETNNIRGGEPGGSKVTLARLFDRLAPQLASLDELVVTHDGYSEAELGDLSSRSGREIRFVLLPPGTGYYRAKNIGFDATIADLVAFADSDCDPTPEWLEALLAPFADSTVGAVAGRTTYREDLFGEALTAIDFPYFPSAHGRGFARNFYANNVAFRREVFAAHRYPTVEGMYRGHCQVLGLALERSGVRMAFAPRAHTVHRLPDTVADFVRLRLHRGADTVELAPHLAHAAFGARRRWLGRLGPISTGAVLAGRFAVSVGAVAGISLIDGTGAFVRAVSGYRFGARDGENVNLAYHNR